MNITENIRIAIQALAANKLRSALTMLGIVIGVGAVVALVAIGNGAAANITEQVEGIGTNMIMIMPGEFNPGQPQSKTYLYYSEYETLAKNVRNATIIPIYQSYFTVKYGTDSIQVSVSGATPEFPTVRGYEVDKGRFLTQADLSHRAQVAVLGSQTADDLFGSLDPLGRKIKIDNISFKVVGVLKEKGSTGFGSADDMVLVPLETGYKKLFGDTAEEGGKRIVSTIGLSVESSEAVNGVIDQVKYILRIEHKLESGEENDFTVISQTAMLSQLEKITSALTLFLTAIAFISLLVGGIGIMNITLVSVTERTREIGLRKAVGAKRAAILFQFLVETMTLSLIGGIAGIGLGVGVAQIFTAIGQVNTQITPTSVLEAFFFALAVGLVFGIYPAFRASRLHPMEALRYE